MEIPKFIPYCGTAPVPGSLAWNLDPALIGIFALGMLGYIVLRQRAKRMDRRLQIAGMAYFSLGWFILGAALMSPLCNLSVALFSARSAQHMLITLVAVPLIVRGGVFPRPEGSRSYLWAPLLFAMTLWAWHMPSLYDATLKNNVVYWLMHASLIVSAYCLWQVLLDQRPGHLAKTLAASLFTGVQTCALGAILTLTAVPWFSVYAQTTWRWGLSAVRDQQLGGVLMWVIGGILLGGYTTAVFSKVIGTRESTLISVPEGVA